MDTLLVVLIVGLAAFYMVRRFYKSTKKQGGCGCGCSPCDTKRTVVSVDCCQLSVEEKEILNDLKQMK